MQDIYRQEEIGHEAVRGIDRFQALTQVGAYLDQVHTNYGAVGEFNLYHVLFREKAPDNSVSRPAQTLPDIVWNPNRGFTAPLKGATGRLDSLSKNTKRLDSRDE
jgi:hypothetical protein